MLGAGCRGGWKAAAVTGLGIGVDEELLGVVVVTEVVGVLDAGAVEGGAVHVLLGDLRWS